MKLSVLGFAVVCLLVAGSAFASEELATKNNCTVCHKMDAPAMGPSMKLIAETNAGGDVEALAAFIKAGGKSANSEKYKAAMPMPPQAKVTDADAKAIAEWIMTLAK
jgi:cytochrome c